MDLKIRRAFIKGGIAIGAKVALEHSGIANGEALGNVAAFTIIVGSDVGSTFFDTLADSKAIREIFLHTTLSQRLEEISGQDDWKPILKRYRATFKANNQFDSALFFLRPEKRREILTGLVKLMDEEWGNKELLQIGSAILTRYPMDIEDSSAYVRISGRLSDVVGQAPPTMAQALESFCYAGFIKGGEGANGPYVKNFAKMITDPDYRAIYHRQRLVYYGSERKALDALIRHFRTRDLTHAINDIGEAISLAPLMFCKPNSIEQLPFVLETLYASARQFGLGNDLMNQAYAAMKRKLS